MKDKSKYTLKELVKILEGLMGCGELYQEAMDAFLGATSAMNTLAANTADCKPIRMDGRNDR